MFAKINIKAVGLLVDISKTVLGTIQFTALLFCLHHVVSTSLLVTSLHVAGGSHWHQKAIDREAVVVSSK